MNIKNQNLKGLIFFSIILFVIIPSAAAAKGQKMTKADYEKLQKQQSQSTHSLEVWNPETKEWESSFKAFIRRKEKEEAYTWFGFKIYDEQKGILMNSQNFHVFIILALIALTLGIAVRFAVLAIIEKNRTRGLKRPKVNSRYTDQENECGTTRSTPAGRFVKQPGTYSC